MNDGYNLLAGVFGRPGDVLEYEYIQSRTETCIKHVESYSFSSTLQQVMMDVANAMRDAGVSLFKPCKAVDTESRAPRCYIESKPIMVLVCGPDKYSAKCDFFSEQAGIWQFELVGTPDFVYAVKTHLDEKYLENQSPTVRWHYVGSHGAEYKDISLTPQDRKDPRDSFYPWLKGGVQDYLNRYTQSTAPILLMAGPPGTGKTSLLRHFMFRYQSMGYRAHISYDERILDSDALFVEFLTSKRPSILVVEDADILLTSRESDANKMISRFLNVSDGLIPLHNKKIVFTTNLSDFQRIDTAMTRPGRCFDFMHCRALEPAEVSAVCSDIGLPHPGGPATLAEIFNQKKNIEPPRMGFV